jgi:cytochrome c oxidase subunit 2
VNNNKHNEATQMNDPHARSTRVRIAAICTAVLAFGAIAVPIVARRQAEPRTIEIVAKRYAFEPAVVEVTIGEPVRFVVKSVDVLHGFAIKKFKIDKDVPAGGDVKIDFTAKEAGEFPIICSVTCGDGHSMMTGVLKVVAKAGGEESK